MRLKPLFLLCIVAIAAVVAVLTARIAYFEYKVYQASVQGETGVHLVSAALAVMEKVSLERGPSNAILGDPAPHRPELLAALSQARTQSEQAIARLRMLLGAGPGGRHREALHYLVRSERQLQIGRENVDRLAGLPQPERQPEAIRAAVQSMILAVTEVGPVVVYLNTETEYADPSLSNPLTAAYLAADLRENAGRLGSQITASLATKRKLTDAEIRDIDHLKGRIELLHELLRQRIRRYDDKPQLIQRLELMEESYFRDGLGFVENLIESGKQSGSYQVMTSEFAARYVPQMAPILAVRDIILDVALRQVRDRRAGARAFLAGVVGGYALLLSILAVMLLHLGRRVIKAFAKTTEVIVAIADGKLDIALPTSGYRDEIDEMLRSIQVLQDGSIRRKQAEERLAESEKKFRGLYDSLKDGVLMTDMAGRILDCNQAYSDMLGYARDEILNLTYQQLTPPKWHEMETGIVESQIVARGYSDEYEKEYLRRDGTVFPVTLRVWLIRDKLGQSTGMWGIVRDITERKQSEHARESLILDLQDALAKVRTLSGLLPICSNCKRIRDDKGYWNQIEVYVREHSDAQFSHGICPQCLEKLYPEFGRKILEDSRKEPNP